MPLVSTNEKSPPEISDWSIDWSDRIGADTIATSVWSVGTGLTKTTDSKTDTVTTVWLSGGTSGNRYRLVNTITTAGGRTLEEVMILDVSAK